MEVIINENERSWVIDLISKINFILSSNDLIIKKAVVNQLYLLNLLVKRKICFQI